MSTEVASLHAKLGADSSQLEAALRRSESAIGRTGQAAGGLAAQLNQMVTFAGGQLLAQGISAIGDSLTKAVHAGIQFNATLEQSTMAFTTMLKSATLASQHISELRDFAKQTAFSFQDLTQQSVRLQAYGFAAKEVVPVLRTVSDAVSALGSGSAGIDRITRALGQMSARGKIQAGDMLQLTEAGIKGWDYLAVGMGKSVAEVMALSEAGSLSAAQGVKMILAGMEQDFGGLSEKYAKSWDGLWNNLGDVWQQATGSVLAPAMASMQSILSDALAALSTPEFEASAKALGDSVGYAFKMIVTGAKDLGSMMSGALSSLTATFEDSANSALDWGINIVVSLASGIIDATGGILSAAVQGVGNMLAFWMEGHSPPRMARDVKIWGENVIEEFLAGMREADFSVLDKVGNMIKSVLDTLVTTGEQVSGAPLFEKLLGTNEQIAKLIADVSNLGGITDDVAQAIADISAGFGSASYSVQSYLTAQMNLIPVTNQLKDAQDELNRVLKNEQDIRKGNEQVAMGFEKRRLELVLQKPTEQREADKKDAKGNIIKGKVSNQKEMDAYKAREQGLAREEEVWRANTRLAEINRSTVVDGAQDKVKALKEERDEIDKQTKAQEGLMKAILDTAGIQKQLQDALKPKAGGGGKAKTPKDAEAEAEAAAKAAEKTASLFYPQQDYIQGRIREVRGALLEVNKGIGAGNMSTDLKDRKRELETELANYGKLQGTLRKEYQATLMPPEEEKKTEKGPSALQTAMEGLGTKMQTAFAPVNKSLKDFGARWDGLSLQFDRFGVAANGVRKWLNSIGLSAQNLSSPVAAVSMAIGMLAGAILAGPWGAAAGGAVGLGLGAMLQQQLPAIDAALKAITENPAWQMAGRMLGGLGEDIGNWAGRIGPLLDPALKSLQNLADWLGRTLGPGLSLMFAGIIPIITGVGNILYGVFGGIIEIVIATLAAFSTGNWGPVLEGFRTLIGGIATGVRQIIVGLGMVIVGLGKVFWDLLGEVAGWAGQFIGTIMGWAGQLGGAIIQVGLDLLVRIGQWSLDINLKIASMAVGIGAAILGWTDEALKAASKVGGEILSVFQTLATNIGKAIIDAFNGAIRLVNGGLGNLRGITLPKIGDVGGGQPFSGLPTIPELKLADGALVTGPTTALIGEERPEVVIPLDRFLKSSQRQSVNLTITLNPPQMARLLRGEIMELNRLSGRA
jgi:tape measure domain-containing protein